MPTAQDGSYQYSEIYNTCTETGGLINIYDVSVYNPNSLIIEVYNNTGHSVTQYFQSNTLNQTVTFSPLPNGLYSARFTTVKDGINQPPDDYFSIANITCGDSDEDDDTENDLIATASTNDASINGGTDGSVTLNVSTSNTPFSTSLNGGTVTPGKIIYSDLAAGDYTATVIDDAGYQVVVNFTITEPEPIPKGPNIYYAVGGTLPNPINYEINLDVNYNNALKVKHFLDIEVYANNELIDTDRARVRFGTAIIDVSGYLRKPLKLDSWGDIMFSDTDLLTPFYIRYRENYNGIVGTWVSTVNDDQKYAVQAALQPYNSNMYAYVAKEEYEAKWLTGFNYPVKFACYGTWLSAIIDNSNVGTPLYWERSYYASDGTLVERRSTLIPESYYGTLVRFQIKDDVLPCANYIDSVITTEYRTLEGTCADITPPIGYKIFTYQFDKTFE